jgi:polysaccharide export outer membrane protein
VVAGLSCLLTFFLLSFLSAPVWAQAQPQNPSGHPAGQPAGQSAAQTVQGVESAPVAPDGTPQPPPAAGPVALKIGPGDAVDITVYNVPELTQHVRVSAAGDAYLALIGYVHLDGMTSDQAQALIEQKLTDGGYLKNPHVTVFVGEYTNQGVSVMGEIQHPGIYPLTGQRRLLDLIAAAGGLTPRAGRVVYITHRDHPTDPVSVALSGDATDAKNNVDILPGDTVMFSKAGVVYVVGDVGHPSGFIMDNNESLTVLQAIALAGGTNRTAKLDAAQIIRKTPKGPEQIPIPLRKILSAKSPDLPLRGDDVLFVPSSAAKSAAVRTLDAILGLASGAALRTF